MVKFDVTYELITEESAEDGEAAEQSFMSGCARPTSMEQSND